MRLSNRNVILFLYFCPLGMWRSPVAYPAVGGMVLNEDMNYVVYILFSDKLGTYYVGQTNNIEKRLITHNKGGKKYTSKGIPWV